MSQCDCSACWKKGYLWVFAEGQDKVEMEKGSDVGSLSEYVCQNRRFAHKVCGSPKQVMRTHCNLVHVCSSARYVEHRSWG